MTSTKTTIPFTGTPEQKAELEKVIADHKGTPGALMPVMQKAQDIYGYLPIEVQTMIAEGLGVSLEQVYGVSTFYAWFSLEPKGKHLIRVCLGTACYVKGSQDILDELTKLLGVTSGHTTPDGMFTLEAARCLGCCGLAPVMMIDDQIRRSRPPGRCKGIYGRGVAGCGYRFRLRQRHDERRPRLCGGSGAAPHGSQQPPGRTHRADAGHELHPLRSGQGARGGSGVACETKPHRRTVHRAYHV